MNTKAEELKARTKRFALRVIELYRTLPGAEEARVLGKQLLRSGTPVAANYRAVCRARSKAEFIAKIGVVVEEADESVLWLELLQEARIAPKDRVEPVWREAEELLAIFAASQRTAKNGSKAAQRANEPMIQ